MPPELPDRPNIIFVFSDQQRWDSVCCYGSEIFKGLTPNLDRMARDGVRFQHAFTPQPVCGPARSCLQTGKWATETGCFTNGIALPLDETTVAHHLSRAGYRVGYVGKWHLASTPREGIDYHARAIPPERRGGYSDFWLASDVLEFTSHAYDGHMFDGEMNRVEFPRGRYRVDSLTDFAIEKIRARDPESPFYMFLSFIEPHQQNDHQRFEGPRGSKTRFAHYKVPGDLAGREGDWPKEMPDYLGQVHRLDANVGRIRRELRRLGMDRDTVLIYASDHGCHFRTRNAEYKRSCHEGSIRVPLIACGPGFPGETEVRELASLIDLPPTLLELAGLRIPGCMRGRSLLPLIEDGPGEWRDEVFIQISEDHVGRALRTDRWKYSVKAPGRHGGRDSSSDLYQDHCLYDLWLDPHETTNLIGDPRFTDVRDQLAGHLITRMVSAGEGRPEIREAQCDA